MPSLSDLPVIDIAALWSDDRAAQGTTARAIAAACETVGFFYVRGHGVPRNVVERAIAAARGYFARPESEKLACVRPLGRYRGFIPTMGFSEDRQGKPTVLYEAFIVGDDVAEDDPRIAGGGGLLWPNVWPDGQPGFRPAITAYRDAARAVAHALVGAFALALDRDETALTDLFAVPLDNMSVLHYPPRPTGQGEVDLRAHHDTNAVTVLLPGEVGGLEVERADGRWIEAPPLDGCLIVNVGNMMECWSGGRFRSTMHRVNPPEGVDRYSIGYFAVPSHDTVVRPLVPASGTVSTPIHVGRDLAAFIARTDDFARRGTTGIY